MAVIKSKGGSSFVKYIKRRIARNKNFMGVITGSTGSGKSYSGISICLEIDKTFNISRVCTTFEQVMDLITSQKEKLKDGSAILWDEAGVDISNRTWQSLTNKLVNYLLQTFRHKQFILILTVPYMDFLDANTRKMFHAEFQVRNINYKKETVNIKPFLIQYNSRNKKFYYKYLRIKTKQGILPLKAWHIKKPPLWFIEEYEALKDKFTLKLNKDIIRQIKAQKLKKGVELTPLQERCVILMTKYDDVEEVAKEMDISPRNVYFHLSRARNKGYAPEETLKGRVKTP